jgi:hypothetical protein
MERFDSGRERLDVIGLHQDRMRRSFRNRRRERGDHRLARGHRLQQHDPETLLHAGQAEDARAIVFTRQFRAGDIAQPRHRLFQFQFARQGVQ